MEPICPSHHGEATKVTFCHRTNFQNILHQSEIDFWDLFTNKVAVEIINEMFADQTEFEEVYSRLNKALPKSLLSSYERLIEVLESNCSMECLLIKTY